jgi:peptidoglycan hydrolase-like protein with peptidoglycan-binding domain
MPVDGVAGTDTQAALLGVGNGEFRTPAKPAVVSTGPFVQFGQTSQQVAAVQRQLRQMEYYQGRLTGYFDQETKDAVTKFQQEQRLTADGVVGPNTLAALEKASAKASDRSSMLSLQKRLKENGFYNGPLNGVFDKQTKAAVEAAQRDYGLSADDIVKGRF